MKLTKYEHACFTIEKDGKLLVVDPGAFTTDLGSPENVAAIVVTHAHPDHFDASTLSALVAHNPSAIILAPEAITNQLDNALPHQTVNAGDELTIAPFELEFFGGEHAVIHPSMPTDPNVGVLIDELVYFPGDSFVVPHKPVDVLALPVSAPWLKLSETMDFLSDIKPRLAFPTHDALLSDTGKSLVDTMLPPVAEKIGVTYQRLHEPLEI